MRARYLPNKPMVPTASASPAANPLRPLRRHIGQPLDSQRAANNALRRSKPRAAVNEQRRRATANKDRGVTTTQVQVTSKTTIVNGPRRATASEFVAAPGVSNEMFERR